VKAELRLNVRERIAHLAIANPDRRNAMTAEMWRALPGLCARIEADRAVLAVILRGEGDHFCAGADIAEFERVFADEATTRAYNAMVQNGLRALQALDKPVIAAIDGHCVGGGVSLLAQCDLVFASQEALFAVTPAKLGLVYGEADTRRLVARIGPARAKDLLFSGRRISAEDALRIGLVDRLIEGESVVEAALAYAAGLTELSQSSIRSQKKLIDAAASGLTSPELFARATDEAAASADFGEGRAAFLARRKPDFPTRG
jgi:enoyl-CoA hydratase/carnithine racemase